RLADVDAELGEAVVRLVDEMRGLHPGLGRDAPDAQARAAELGLLLDAGDPGAQLGGADRRGVTARPATEDGNVKVHLESPLSLLSRASGTAAARGGSGGGDTSGADPAQTGASFVVTLARGRRVGWDPGYAREYLIVREARDHDPVAQRLEAEAPVELRLS